MDFTTHSKRLALALATVLVAPAQQHITTPKQHFGFDIGDDCRMASYTQIETYWKKLARESDRVKLTDMSPAITIWSYILTSTSRPQASRAIKMARP